MTMRAWAALASVLPLAAVAALATQLRMPPHRAAWALDDPAMVAQGRRVYANACASCHGDKLQGQPRWWQLGADGMLPAQPHDASGHSWQHSDAELHDLVAHSVSKYAPPGYRTAMPAFEGRLSNREIDASIAYIKSTWPMGVRAYQAAQNPGGPSLAEMPGDWHFPATCNIQFGSPPKQGDAR